MEEEGWTCSHSLSLSADSLVPLSVISYVRRSSKQNRNHTEISITYPTKNLPCLSLDVTAQRGNYRDVLTRGIVVGGVGGPRKEHRGSRLRTCDRLTSKCPPPKCTQLVSTSKQGLLRFLIKIHISLVVPLISHTLFNSFCKGLVDAGKG